MFISGGLWTLMQIDTISVPPNSLNNADFPSITGNPPNGVISPYPRTAVPSVTITV